MSGLNDREYYERRSSQERMLAQAACEPHVRKLHLEMAERYADLAGMDNSAAVKKDARRSIDL